MPGHRLSRSDYYATAIYSTLFGGGMSSRLFQRIRESAAWSMAFTAFNAAYANGGCSHLCRHRQDDLSETGAGGVPGIRRVAETLAEAELVRARNQIKAGTLMALESSAHAASRRRGTWCSRPADSLWLRSWRRIEAVDQEAVRRVRVVAQGS